MLKVSTAPAFGLLVILWAGRVGGWGGSVVEIEEEAVGGWVERLGAEGAADSPPRPGADTGGGSALGADPQPLSTISMRPSKQTAHARCVIIGGLSPRTHF